MEAIPPGQLATSTWGATPKKFDAALVDTIYATHIRGSGFDAKSLAFLEASRYLEAYLWPGFTAQASLAHVMSIVLMFNEKVRQETVTWKVGRRRTKTKKKNKP